RATAVPAVRHVVLHDGPDAGGRRRDDDPLSPFSRRQEGVTMQQLVELVEDSARGVRLEVLIQGTGPDVMLVPSAMRGASDFAHLQAALTQAGYRSLAVNPRHAGRSVGPLDSLTLQDIADDIALVVTSLCDGPAHLVGH